MVTETSGPRRITGLSDLAGQYDGLLCDVWGVLHNGVRAFAPAVAALARFRDGGGRVVLITNSPRPSRQVREQLQSLGVKAAAYDAVISSGDVTRQLLAARAGKAMFHLGPERDSPVFAGLDIAVEDPETADFVLITGLDDDESETPDDYRDLLESLRARDLEAICANPDVVVERGDQQVYCAGALAQAYEAMGGRVIYAGKPYAPIYRAALGLIDETSGRTVPKARILAIGDSISTDLKGAADAGLKTLFVMSGIHGRQGEAPARLSEMFAEAGVEPLAVLETLVW